MTRNTPKPLPPPPCARKVPREEVVHGDRRVDDYFWMRDKEQPEVIAHLEANNAHADAVLAPTEPFQETLYQEMLGRIQQTDSSVPYREGDHLYFTRTEEGKQYAIHCRKGNQPDAPEETLLDLNRLAEGKSFMELGAVAASDDGAVLAYSTDDSGFREYTLCFKRLDTGELLPERIPKTGSLAWARDSHTLYYTVEDEAKRPYRVYLHSLGSGDHELVYEEPDAMFRVHVTRTRSKAFLLLYSASHTASECRVLSADRPEGSWRLVAPREKDHEYDVHHCGERFYIRTNDRGRNFRLVSAPVSDPHRDSWQEVVPHRAEVMLEDVELFSGHCVLLERAGGLPRLRVMELRTGQMHHVEFPEPAYSCYASANRELETTKFRFTYESFVTPASVFDYDMETRERKLLKRTPVLGGFDPSRYTMERRHATAEDGTRVPVSVARRKDVELDGSAPLLLYGYGSYGYPLPVTFSSNRLCLLDRGVVFAMAHVRGGGELGKAWHDQGRMRAKRNTFTDFIAAADHLVREGYTSSGRLVISGGSAGGLLMGAVVNMRPELAKAVLSVVPFVDVINTMLDQSLPLTAGEWEEWGNPAKRADYEYMKTYCPYTNLEARHYPAMLVRASLHDSQVMYWEPAKYVAKLRALKTDDNPLLLKTNMTAGHGGASGRYDYLREVALDYAFILVQVGISN